MASGRGAGRSSSKNLAGYRLRGVDGIGQFGGRGFKSAERRGQRPGPAHVDRHRLRRRAARRRWSTSQRQVRAGAALPDSSIARRWWSGRAPATSTRTRCWAHAEATSGIARCASACAPARRRLRPSPQAAGRLRPGRSLGRPTVQDHGHQPRPGRAAPRRTAPAGAAAARQPRTCSFGSIPMPCQDPDLGWWSDARAATSSCPAPQPPTSAPAWDGPHRRRHLRLLAASLGRLRRAACTCSGRRRRRRARIRGCWRRRRSRA